MLCSANLKKKEKEKGEGREEEEEEIEEEKEGKEEEGGGRKERESELAWAGLGSMGVAESSTVVNEELEDARELGVLTDIEDVRENLYHLLLLGRQNSVPGASGGRRAVWASPVPRASLTLVPHQPSSIAPPSFTSTPALFLRPLASSGSLLAAGDPTAAQAAG